LVALEQPPETQKLRRAVLITDRDGNRIPCTTYAATCRHGQPTMSGLLDLDDVWRVARDVLAGRATRPVSLTV